MRNRRPFNLLGATRVYNFFQISCCITSLATALKLRLPLNVGWSCYRIPTSPEEVTADFMNFYALEWWCILFRMSEFFETIVFVLRKKQNQVSILHVYHHIIVVTLLWVHLKYNAGINECFIFWLNTSVHVVMYTYYFLSSFENLKPSLAKVKIFLTTLQIAQLFLLFLHCIFVLNSCYDSWVYKIQTANLGLLIALFVNFFVRSYLKKKKKAL